MRKRKQDLLLGLVKLKEERSELVNTDLSEDQIEKFLELVTSLAELHRILTADEKRYMLENCFSNRTVSDNEPCLEPHSWLTSRDFSELTPLVNQIGPLLELLSHSGISQRAELKDSKHIKRCLD